MAEVFQPILLKKPRAKSFCREACKGPNTLQACAYKWDHAAALHLSYCRVRPRVVNLRRNEGRPSVMTVP